MSEAQSEAALTHAHVADEVLDGGLLEKLGEQARPVWVHCHVGRLDQGADVVGLHRQEQVMRSLCTSPLVF